jgi:hypothetical protein
VDFFDDETVRRASAVPSVRSHDERIAREPGIDPWELRTALYMEVDRRSRERAARHAPAHTALDRRVGHR